MKKVAKLVCVSLMTRIVVDENATEEQMMELARPQLIEKLQEDGLLDHVESIEDDEECPFGTFVDDVNKMELIGEDIFLSDDTDENYPVRVFADGNDTEESPIRIYTLDGSDNIRVFGLTKPQTLIEVENRNAILTSAIGRYTPEDEVSLQDIFMQGEFIFEIK